METLDEVIKLKKEKDAVILAHYYVPKEVQKVADYIGDSYFLSKKAVELTNKVIVFAGVQFMGESAKLLNPQKTILMPNIKADCPMAHMVDKKFVDDCKKKYDDLAVVCYINSTAEIKSWCDVTVTSANAVKIVRNLKQKNILFIPDKNLARYVAEQVPEKNIIINDGYCPIHEKMKAQEIMELKKQYPNAQVLAHPECNKEIIQLANYIGSTSGIINYVKENKEFNQFIIATEIGVEFALKNARSDAEFFFTKTKPICVDMKLNTLSSIKDVLKNFNNEVLDLNNDIKIAAKQTLTNMLELASK